MRDLLWLVPLLPFAGFVLLISAGARMPRQLAASVGTGSIGISALLSMLIAFDLITTGTHAFSQTLWTWVQVGGFGPRMALYLDPLSVVMMFVITFVGFLIQIYSVEYMKDDEGFSRFFGYMNLFIGFMLILVLADNLLLLYLGWEGVGLCSYLLIGFWYADPANGHAARKAFVVTRVGDSAMAVGVFLVFTHLGTLQIQDMLLKAQQQWPAGSAIAITAAALLLAGAVGKSAQLPLQTWLPDAMAGPTPVSALIHSATMVTAGVYLIARLHVLFELAPPVRAAVAIIGAFTLLMAGLSALVQRDIKRILAYSTISQIGYMFLALGAGAWTAAVFHLMTHAFFKSLLFLGAGAVILSLNHEQDISRMGGLRSRMPFVFWPFLIGSASLSALPFVTAGFYSKELILRSAWNAGTLGPWLWAAGVAGALITSLYSFRLVFTIFYGVPKSAVTGKPGMTMRVPLVILAALSVTGGFIQWPIDSSGAFSVFLSGVLPSIQELQQNGTDLLLQFIAALASVSGILIAYLVYIRSPHLADGLPGNASILQALQRFWFSGWGFDTLYDTLIVKPFLRFAGFIKNDLIDLFFEGVAWYSEISHGLLSSTQTGRLRWYALWIAAGAVIIIGVVVFR
ncbi:MAG: NADH-quinone oxidoreductase subunit L [Thermodesulfovibrionales bacterium]